MKKDEYYHLLANAFSWMNQLTEKKEEVQKDELENFFTEDLEICTNNQPLIGLDKFHQHLKESLSQYSHSKVLFPFKAYLSDNRKAVLYYLLRSTTINEEVFDYCVMSIFKFRNGKISSWTEVVSEVAKK